MSKTASRSACIYEELAKTSAMDDGIRPGGLELTDHVLSSCKFPVDSLILDIGCGTGATLDHVSRIHQLRAVGIDPSGLMLEKGRSRNTSLKTSKARAEDLPFASMCFDGILLECSLSLTDNVASVLSECRRVLKSLGKMIITDVYARNTDAIPKLRALQVGSCLRGALDLDELQKKLIKEGFRIILCEDHSDELRSFAAQLVWNYGSIAQFWAKSGCSESEPASIAEAVRECRPGYFLLIATKADR